MNLRKHLTIIWIFTGFVALLLLVTTLRLSAQAGSVQEEGIRGTISGSPGAIYLRDSPDTAGAVITILELGDAVQILQSKNEQGVAWHFVETDLVSGWIPAERVALESP